MYGSVLLLPDILQEKFHLGVGWKCTMDTALGQRRFSITMYRAMALVYHRVHGAMRFGEPILVLWYLSERTLGTLGQRTS